MSPGRNEAGRHHQCFRWLSTYDNMAMCRMRHEAMSNHFYVRRHSMYDDMTMCRRRSGRAVPGAMWKREKVERLQHKSASLWEKENSSSWREALNDEALYMSQHVLPDCLSFLEEMGTENGIVMESLCQIFTLAFLHSLYFGI